MISPGAGRKKIKRELHRTLTAKQPLLLLGFSLLETSGLKRKRLAGKLGVRAEKKKRRECARSPRHLVALCRIRKLKGTKHREKI